MATMREQILARAETLLSTTPPSGVPTVKRTRIDSPVITDLPALTLVQWNDAVAPQGASRPDEPDRDDSSMDGALVNRWVDLRIEALAAGSDGVPEDAACDPLLAWVVKALLAEGAFTGLANRVRELGTQFEYERAERPFCRATMTVRVKYQSKTDDAELRY